MQTTTPGQKRPSVSGNAESASGSTQRSKRAKYASIACNECKKKKLKCVRESGNEACDRCAAYKVECVFAHAGTIQPSREDNGQPRRNSVHESQANLTSLNQQVIALQNQVDSLTTALRDITDRVSHSDAPSTVKSTSHASVPSYRNEIRNVRNKPREPQFVGPMRSAYSIQIVENSLTGMGIETRLGTPALSSTEAGPGAESPSLSPAVEDVDILPSLGMAEIHRLLEVYDEEVQSIYPFLGTKQLFERADYILQGPSPCESQTENNLKNVQMIKLAVATSVAIEAQGPNNVSKRLIDDVEPVICRVSGEAFIDLLELQLMIMLSIYWFHCGEELLAWRAIGLAGREVLEIGLHRRSSLLENFKDPSERELAIRCFWCVYILDRRWSFGTSLSFGVFDRDIDPQLPEPGDEHHYLRCMVSYARLCSKVWEELPLDSSPLSVPKDKVDFLDFLTQKWIHSIPEDLQLVYPRLSQAPRHQPRVLQRLRTLLYLRGNHIRNLVLRHHVLSTSNVRADKQGAQLIVSLAQDTIQVLVHLNETSDIYTRQKHTFNYFLLGALASILLAVCHAPDMFADRCRQSFLDAMGLLKGTSSQGLLSQRLWRSIRGTLHRALSLRSPVNTSGDTAFSETRQQDENHVTQRSQSIARDNQAEPSSLNLDESVADIFGLETDLINLFGSFEQDCLLQSMQVTDQHGFITETEEPNRFSGIF